MTLKQLIDIELNNERKFNFCIYIKQPMYDMFTSTIEMSFRDLTSLLGLFLLNSEIEEWQEFENNIIYIKLKDI